MKPEATEHRPVLSSRQISQVRISLIVLGLLLLGLGLWRGEAQFVLRRAIIICLGCIGIG